MAETTLAELDAALLTKGLRFFYEQVGKALGLPPEEHPENAQEKQGSAGARAMTALPVATEAAADLFEHYPVRLHADSTLLRYLDQPLRTAREDLAFHIGRNGYLDPTDTNLLRRVDAFRCLTETIFHQDLTFRGERRHSEHRQEQNSEEHSQLQREKMQETGRGKRIRDKEQHTGSSNKTTKEKTATKPAASASSSPSEENTPSQAEQKSRPLFPSFLHKGISGGKPDTVATKDTFPAAASKQPEATDEAPAKDQGLPQDPHPPSPEEKEARQDLLFTTYNTGKQETENPEKPEKPGEGRKVIPPKGSRLSLVFSRSENRKKKNAGLSLPPVATGEVVEKNDSLHTEQKALASSGPEWLFPRKRNLHFVGREAVLTGLREALTTLSCVVLLPEQRTGIGLSTLATEYAYRYGNDYDIICWLPARSAACLPDYYTAFIKKTEHARASWNVQQTLDSTWDALAKKGRSLLIFDDAAEEELLRPYLPDPSLSHVIITSRWQNWSDTLAHISIGVFSQEDAAWFLCRRTGQYEGKKARALADALERHPAALELCAAGILAAKDMHFIDYFHLFQERTREKSAGTVDIAAALSYELLTEESGSRSLRRAAEELLHLLAFLGAHDIPFSLLSAKPESLPSHLRKALRKKEQFQQVLNLMSSLSLLTTEEENVRMPRVLQETFIARMTTEEQASWAEATVELANEAFADRAKKHEFVGTGIALGHLDVALSHMRIDEDQGAGIVEPLTRTGDYFFQRGNLHEAERRFMTTAALHKELRGPVHPDMAATLARLARIEYTKGNLPTAQQHAQQAVAINRAAFGADHSSLGGLLAFLGLVEYKMGNLETAQGLLERALRIKERSHDSTPKEIARLLNDLGSVEYASGHMRMARNHFERALTLNQKVYGKAHWEVAICLLNLATVEENRGDAARAKKHVKRAYEIFEKTLGPDHPETLVASERLLTLE